MKIDKERLRKYIRDKHASPCPLCGNNQWTFSDTVFQLMEFDYNGLRINGSVFPVIPLTCEKCGNTYFINVLKAGLMDKKVEENIKDEDKE